MIAIIDYGVGNIFSLYSSFGYIGAEAVLTDDREVIRRADRVVLPGVGAFGDAAEKLRRSGLDREVLSCAESGKPLLGICLGMQLLFEKSFEYGEHLGLGLIKGKVVSMEPEVPKGYKVPHIGWNSLYFPENKQKSPLFRYIDEGDFVYFVHTFYGTECSESVIAGTEYGIPLTAAVSSGNVYGVQFHPEKSGQVGMNILKAFCEIE
ncbi:MAG: imidazole glycerol phosphate synthase subunit HisH [Anaerovoracaceae bacterium]